tara:strand:- start:151 stop:459 length:309 start_codon:yes stop_codon:yes gene_type:complete
MEFINEFFIEAETRTILRAAGERLCVKIQDNEFGNVLKTYTLNNEEKKVLKELFQYLFWRMVWIFIVVQFIELLKAFNLFTIFKYIFFAIISLGFYYFNIKK